MEWVSSKDVIGKVLRDTNIVESGWIEDGYIWIAEALQYIGTNHNKVVAMKEVEVTSKYKLPCNAVDLLGIEHEGCFLDFQNSIGFYNIKDTVQIIPYINGNYIYLNTTDPKTVKFYYTKELRNCEDDILFDGHIKIQDAIYWYLMVKLLGAGYKHPIFDYKYCYAMWVNSRDSASNYCKLVSPLEIENVLREFRNSTITLSNV